MAFFQIVDRKCRLASGLPELCRRRQVAAAARLRPE